MSIDDELLVAANWLREHMATDEDVATAVNLVCIVKGCDSLAELFDGPPEDVIRLAEGLKDMAAGSEDMDSYDEKLTGGLRDAR